MEESSSHILAHVIVKAAASENVRKAKISKLHEEAGFGLTAVYKKQAVILGKKSLMEKNGIKIPKNLNVSSTASFIAINGKLAGSFVFKDTLRTETKASLKLLEGLGMQNSLMLTGDNEQTAKEIAKQLGITKVGANLLPAEKLAKLKNIPDTERLVAMVGDGVNDAPTLAAADVGIALGAKGSTAASESADVVIMLDDLKKVPESFKISKDTFKVARQAILLGISISVGLMLVYSTGKFSPVSGAAVQELIDITVMIYALRAHGPWRKVEQII